jgi:hypothetical protein
MIRDRLGRFGGFACLPLPDVDGALAELAYALDDLGLDGVLLFSNARGILLGGPAVHPRCSTSCNGARPWCSCIPIPRPIPAPTRSDCPTRLSTSLPIPPGPSPSCITAAPSPAPPTSSTSSPAPEVPCPIWPGGSASSTRCASSPEPRAARPRPRHSAACTGIPRRPGATRAARRRGNRPRRIRHRLPLNAPRPGRLLPRPHRGHPGTHRRRADGRPRRHGHDADPATGHPASQDPDPRFITRPGHP